MEYSILEDDTSLEIALSGAFGYADNDKVHALVAALDSCRTNHSTLSLDNLESIDSAGLGMLIILSDAAQDRGVSLSIRGARGQVKKMLEITEISAMVQVEA